MFSSGSNNKRFKAECRSSCVMPLFLREIFLDLLPGLLRRQEYFRQTRRTSRDGPIEDFLRGHCRRIFCGEMRISLLTKAEKADKITLLYRMAWV
jgi:hypothetical protein